MLRKLSKKLVGKRPENMRVSDYYKIVNHVESKIKEGIITIFMVVVILVSLTVGIVHWWNTPTGYYAPDYVDENGVMYDIDGDGDMYHWVEE